MNKTLSLLAGGLLFSAGAFAQKGLIISEVLANPDGTDSPYEYIELLATTNIDFATTPYTVVVCDNGSATSNGWKEGNSHSYAFEITSGTVTAGQVVYVGGTSMLPISNGGIIIRSKNTSSAGGDGIGNANTDGVIGNGGDNADGVAVFNMASASINSSKVPVDAIFFGDAIGSAFKSSGSGYQLPVNDAYSGGKLQTTSFIAPDPGANQLVKATAGVYNATTGTFTTARTWAVTTGTSYGQTSVTLTGTTASNVAPVITLAAPTVSGAAPATVILTATATDSDGSIASVKFYNGSTLLATVTAAPFTYSWTSVAAGTYTLMAVATDNSGATTTSSSQSVTVTASGTTNVAPVVTLATPTVSGTAPATVSLSATATDSDGTIASVKFYNGSTLLATVTTAPYAYSWTSVAAGTYTLTAVATDNSGTSTTSSGKSVTVSSAAANVAPTLAFNTTASTLVNLAGGKVSCTIGDEFDPVIVNGLDINVTDEDLSSLVFTMTSSKTSVVPNANFSITGTGSARKLKITPVAAGYATVTLKVTDNGGLNKSISLELAVSNAYSTTDVADYYHTGFADASAAIAIDSNYVFVADDETNLISLYNRKASGAAIYSFDAGAHVSLEESDGEIDIEAAFISPTNPNRIYWLSSQGNSKKGNVKADRDRVFATDIVGIGANATLSFVGYYKGLRSKVIAWGDANGYNLTDAAADGEIPKEIDGYNIEGAEMAPDGTTLYIGFRAPYVNTSTRNKALICPLKNFETWFNGGSVSGSPTFNTPIELNLGTRGIRDMRKNASNQYIIIAGSYDATDNFALYSWNGNSATAPVNLNVNLTNLKPEAIAEVPASLASGFQIQLISDVGGDDIYNEGAEQKDNATPVYKKFVSSYFNVGAVTMSAKGFFPAALASAENKLHVYPNPTNGTLSIEMENNNAGVNGQVYNAMGAVVASFRSENAVAMVDLSMQPAGIYFVHVAGTNQIAKVVKQ